MNLSRLFFFTALASSSEAFVPSSPIQQHTRLPQATALSAALSSSSVPSDDMIRKDIEAMREEARQRLQHLNHELEGFIDSHDQHNHKDNKDDDFLHKASSFESAEVPLHSKTGNVVVDQSHIDKVPISVENIPKQSTDSAETTNHVVAPTPPHYFADSKLLHDTRWKVVIQVGTKRQTERYQEKLLLLHLVVDFSSDKLKESDDLLQGSANAKTLVVQEAWVGAGSHTEGHQRDVRLKPAGGWKVLPGQGPKGIDILRFYFDVEEEICHNQSSNLRCPARRVYCTAGIFSMEHHNESELFKDQLRSELETLVNEYNDLTFQEENDERTFSLERVKRAKQMMELRAQIREMNQKITQARIRDPEKSMLRLSRKGDVGVTKDGQVCYRETKGLSSEYLVLGKMEMASIYKPVIEPTKSSSPTKANDDSEQLRP